MTKLTKQQIIDELVSQLGSFIVSFRESDGKIHDVNALHSIRCLRAAIRILRRVKG